VLKMQICVTRPQCVNKIALPIGWKICCWYLAVTVLRVRCSLYGQCRL